MLKKIYNTTYLKLYDSDIIFYRISQTHAGCQHFNLYMTIQYLVV